MPSLTEFFDEHKISAVLMVLAILPMFVNITLPMTVTQQTKDYYNQVKALKPGDRILVGLASEVAGGWIGSRDATRAIFESFIERGAKFIFICLGPAATGEAEYVVSYTNFAKFGYKYGDDYVISPYIAGEETAMSKVAADMRGAFPLDYYGNDVSKLAVMNGVFALKDVQMIELRPCKYEMPSQYVRQWASKAWLENRIPTISELLATLIQSWYGVYIFGNLDELRGFGEFEYLTGKGGEELFRVTGRNVITYGAFVLIFAGIVDYRLRSMRAKTKVSGKEAQST
jgi:hypothetical protein